MVKSLIWVDLTNLLALTRAKLPVHSEPIVRHKDRLLQLNTFRGFRVLSLIITWLTKKKTLLRF